MTEDDPSITYVPLAELTTQKNGHEVLLDHFWAIHPERGAIFYTAHRRFTPQCNRDKAVSDLMIGQLYPFAKCERLEAAYVRI